MSIIEDLRASLPEMMFESAGELEEGRAHATVVRLTGGTYGVVGGFNFLLWRW